MLSKITTISCVCTVLRKCRGFGIFFDNFMLLERFNKMEILGLQKLTLLDYPKKCAATIFLGGCNFRCPFCHNGDLVCDNFPLPLSEDEVFTFLKKRQGILDGVCITGGEPLLNKDIASLIVKIRSLGYLIKLDTNGSNPTLLKELLDDGVINYAAMDIKNSLGKYPESIGISDFNTESITASAEILINSGIDYEFRTTVVSELHEKSDFEKIGAWLKGCKNFYLQKFEDSEYVIQKGLHSPSDEQLREYAEILKKYIKNVGIRGIDK